ncbi:MAG: rRNA methyltransferase [Acidobacteria bacterium]|nr:rRNA methyltransferase [Acidobacteriota bacterium]
MLLTSLESTERLRLEASPAWASIRARFASAGRLVDLDRLEDEIDAVFCAHLAWLWAERPGALTVYGDLASGYIVAPPTPTHDPTPRAGQQAEGVGRAAVGVGPWVGPLPEGDRWDPELLAHGDSRNVIDRYRYWRVEAIVADLDTRRHPFAVAIENWQHDMNIGSIVRTANAFAAETVHIVGRRRWNRRGAMVTDRYQHVQHHEDVAGLLSWAADRALPVIAVDNVPGSVPVEVADLPERCVLLFGQEGPGLTAEALAGADAVVEIRQFGSTRSINASAAAAIVMHEWIRRWAR